MNKGARALLFMLLLTLVGGFVLISSIQSRQFRLACEQTCETKGLRYEWRVVIAPLLVPECTCSERRVSKGASK